MATNNEHQYIKCVAWYAGAKDDLLHQVLAVGQASGKVALTNFARSLDTHRIFGKEFGMFMLLNFFYTRQIISINLL